MDTEICLYYIDIPHDVCKIINKYIKKIEKDIHLEEQYHDFLQEKFIKFIVNELPIKIKCNNFETLIAAYFDVDNMNNIITIKEDGEIVEIVTEQYIKNIPIIYYNKYNIDKNKLKDMLKDYLSYKSFNVNRRITGSKLYSMPLILFILGKQYFTYSSNIIRKCNKLLN